MEALARLYRDVIAQVGEDPNRTELQRTPARAAAALRELTRGYRQTVDQVLNGALFATEYDDMVIVRDIEFYSLCEHHLLPFFGVVHVGYLPRGKIVGLSKIPRLVEMFSRRLQVQERMTHEIAHTLHEAIGARGVAVVVEAQHLCMMIRGVEKQNSKLVTSAVLGLFRSDARTREEFMNLLRGA